MAGELKIKNAALDFIDRKLVSSTVGEVIDGMEMALAELKSSGLPDHRDKVAASNQRQTDAMEVRQPDTIGVSLPLEKWW